jgi:hypothetical protein
VTRTASTDWARSTNGKTANRCFERLLCCEALAKEHALDHALHPTANTKIAQTDGDRRDRLHNEGQTLGDEMLGQPIHRGQRAECREREHGVQRGAANDEA